MGYPIGSTPWDTVYVAARDEPTARLVGVWLRCGTGRDRPFSWPGTLKGDQQKRV